MIGANFARRKGIKDATSNATLFSVPSVGSFPIILTIGKSNGDAYASAIDKFWASLRSGNTGSTVYSKLDLQAYLLNLRQILAEIRLLRRAYGVIKKFDLFDKTTPISIFKAMGLDYDTFAANAADLRNELNYVSVQLHTIMPGKLDILERTCWMFDNIFKDSDDAKAQLYLFTLSTMDNYLYDWTNSALLDLGSTSITNFANTSTGTGVTYAVAMANLKSHITVALNSDKVQLIAADILKCYGTGQITYFDIIPENYSVNYIYSEEVLTQIQNARIMNGTNSSTAIQDTSYNLSVSGDYFTSEAHIAGGPVTEDGSEIIVQKAFINMYKNNISNLDLLGATRLTWTATPDSGVAGRLNIDNYGTELVRGFNIVSNIKPYGDSATYKYDLFTRTLTTLMSFGSYSIGNISESLKQISLWATFDWAPCISCGQFDYYDSAGAGHNTGYASDPIWDFNNYAVVDNTQLSTYNDIAILSLYYIPSMVRNVNLISMK